MVIQFALFTNISKSKIQLSVYILAITLSVNRHRGATDTDRFGSRFFSYIKEKKRSGYARLDFRFNIRVTEATRILDTVNIHCHILKRWRVTLMAGRITTVSLHVLCYCLLHLHPLSLQGNNSCSVLKHCLSCIYACIYCSYIVTYITLFVLFFTISFGLNCKFPAVVQYPCCRRESTVAKLK